MAKLTLFTLAILFSSVSFIAGLGCSRKDVTGESFVCVCNATYCDTVEPIGSVTKGKYVTYSTTRDGSRLTRSLGSFTQTSNKTDINDFIIDKTTKYQEILGFGGAFTDATGINLKGLNIATQQKLLQSYFSSEGIEYSLGRIPMASCDFSTRQYSYDDVPNDFELKHFKLAPEDDDYKIPYIEMAKKMSKRNITLFGSPWSSPAWMKTNNNMTGKGSIIGTPGGKYYKSWANYFVKFLEEYQSRGIDIWGITAQNEPTTGMLSNYSFQALGFTAELQRDFIINDLGPVLKNSKFSHVKLMILDDQRILLPGWAKTVLSSKEAAKYVSGIGVHWYLDYIIPPEPLSWTHELFPDKFLLATEACAGERFWETPIILGSWERFNRYAEDIMEDLSNWVVGWTDWNMALDLEGGPNWVSNFVDSPIVVNATNNEFYKQPTFYAMGHFSKFLPPKSQRVRVSGGNTNLKVLFFITPENYTVSIVYNRQDYDQSYRIYDKDRGYIGGTAPAQSLHTIVWP